MRLFRLAVILTLGLVAAPLAAEAQQGGKVPRIGVLWVRGPDPLREGLLKTAKALGLTIPQTVLVRADQVIE